MREVLENGSAQGARARGLPEWKILVKYGLAPASGSMIAYLGTQTGALLAGTFVTETIFNWPGMGTLMVDAVLIRDYPIVEITAFVTASFCVCGTLLGDLLRLRVDPRREFEIS